MMLDIRNLESPTNQHRKAGSCLYGERSSLYTHRCTNFRDIKSLLKLCLSFSANDGNTRVEKALMSARKVSLGK